MNNKLRHLNISDLHISTYKDPSEYFDELMDIIKYIDTIRDEIDVITLAGDIFDKVYPTNHKAIQIAIDFIDTLYRRAKAYNFLIFLIKGTESHDSSQLDIFKGYENDNTLYVIKDVAFYDIKGMIFRFIPEYYSQTYEELHDKAFTTKSDITVYHGTIESVMPFLKHEKISTVKNAQIIPNEDILMATGLYSVCGHIHNRRTVNKNLWYTGSYSSKSFSDAGSKKGFDDITINLDRYTYDVKFIENTKCKKYHVIDGTKQCKQTLPKIKAFLNNIKMDSGKLDIIRIDVNTDTYSDEQYKTLNFVIGLFKNIFNFNISRQVINTSNSEDIIKDAEYVMSPTVSLTDKIHKTIEEIYDVDISVERIKEILDIPNSSDELETGI